MKLIRRLISVAAAAASVASVASVVVAGRGCDKMDLWKLNIPEWTLDEYKLDT